jgi:tripartite-type tricarboxylate transporter receptor subunit TctC
MPDFDVSAWYGLAAPAGTPAEVVARIGQALEKISRDPEIARSMESRGADVGFLNAPLMGAFMSADAAKWKRVASFAKITLG